MMKYLTSPTGTWYTYSLIIFLLGGLFVWEDHTSSFGHFTLRLGYVMLFVPALRNMWNERNPDPSHAGNDDKQTNNERG